MAGRPKIPTELKRLKGTLNTTREKNNPSADVAISETSIIIPAGTKVSVPKTIKTKFVKKYWKQLIENLEVLHVLSKADLPQLENLCITLEKLREVQEVFSETSVFDEEFDLIEKRFTRLSQKFDLLASKYYISPQARTQLRLQDLNLVKTSQEIEKNKQSAVGNLLASRKLTD